MLTGVHVEKNVVVRAKTTSSKVINCTIADRILRGLAVAVAFYYPHALDEDALIEGLAAALERVPAFAGRIRANGEAFQILCDNSGVAWSRATSGHTVEEAIAASSRGEAAGLVDFIDPKKACGAHAPLFTARLCRFKDHGSTLGLCWHHPIGDMHSFMLLMRAWSAAVEGHEIADALLVEDRTDYLNAHIPKGGGRSTLRLLAWSDIARLAAYMAWDARRKAPIYVEFSDAEIDHMRDSMSEATGQRLSANDVVCAHLMEIIGDLDDVRRERTLAMPVNYRRHAGLDPRLIGNLVSSILVSCHPDDKAEQLGVRIRERLTRYAEEHMNYHATLSFVRSHGGVSCLKRCVDGGIDPLNRTLLVTNWSKFGVYDVSFGRQTPLYFSAGGDARKVPFPWLASLVEGRGNRGLRFAGVLPRALAARLRSEQGQARLHRFRA
jgi:hypothetical protein